MEIRFKLIFNELLGVVFVINWTSLLARAETEGIARRQAEELTADLEKDKAVRELEIEDNERTIALRIK